MHGSTPEESEEEDSLDDEIEAGDWNHVQFAAKAPKPVIKILRHVALGYRKAFPTLDGKTYLDPIHFDLLLGRIRMAFWNHRIRPTHYDTSSFVKEWPPVGSQFSPHGYLTPEGTFVSQSMRNGVKRVRDLYQAVG